MSVCRECMLKPPGLGEGAVICETVHGTVYPATLACHMFRAVEEVEPLRVHATNRAMECPYCSALIYSDKIPTEFQVSLLDFFAGCALIGYLAKGYDDNTTYFDAFRIARDMILEHEQKGGSLETPKA